MSAFDASLSAFLAHLRGLGRAVNTLAAYRHDLVDFLSFAAEQGASSVTDLAPTYASSWLATLADQGIVVSSRARKLNALHTFAKFLVLTNRINRDFTLGLDAPKVDQKEPRVLSKTEVKALQGVCASDERDAAMVETLLQTGLRVGELIALILDDVVWGSGQDTMSYMVVRHGKGNKMRRVPLNSRGERALKRWLKVRPKGGHPQLFLSKRQGKPLYSADVRAMLRKYYAKANIKGATVHTLRHTFCTHHAAAGTNLVVIQRAAGHASLTTTQRYLHLVDRMMEDALEEHTL